MFLTKKCNCFVPKPLRTVFNCVPFRSLHSNFLQLKVENCYFFFVSRSARHLFDIQRVDSVFLKHSFAPARLMESDKKRNNAERNLKVVPNDFVFFFSSDVAWYVQTFFPHSLLFDFLQIYRNCVVSIPPQTQMGYSQSSETFFQIWVFLLFFLNLHDKSVHHCLPSKSHSNSNHQNPSETFEIIFLGGAGDYTITVMNPNVFNNSYENVIQFMKEG